ncbi:MAG: two-component sensor histidine kinase [Myxococcales bacterium]|nr:two-component sensor histidine kinase [Myxococcales bacterium]
MPVRLGIPEQLAGAPLPRRLAWVTAARLLFLTAALGVIGTFYLRGAGPETISVRIGWATLAFAFASAGVYAAVLRSGRGLELMALAQLVVDQATWTVLVYLSGGAASGATSFYGLTCVAGAALSGLRGAAVAAVSGGLFYIGLVTLLARRWLLPPADQPLAMYRLSRDELVYYVLVTLLMLAVVTLLSGYLAERLRIASGRLVLAEERADRAERLAALGRLATGLAHEIRNPLGSIAGSIQLLRESPALSEEDKELCDIVQREAARLNDLVTDMMDLTRRREPELADVDAAQVAREVVSLASKSGRGVSDVGLVYEGVEGAVVRADAAQLKQLIWNLVRNAVQASSAGDVVTVTLAVEDDRASLAVSDHGPGIDEQARDRLFDAFFTTRSHGTGVGLAVVKSIADAHGFALDVESEQGQGATFRVQLGAVQATGPTAAGPEPA